VAHLLLVEDETKLLESLSRGLIEEGYSVSSSETCAAARKILASEDVDALILDLMLPDEDGLQLLRGLRREGFCNPVIIVTARDAVEDRIDGLDSGADDYLVKPFSFHELLARLRALFRRNSASVETVLRCDGLEMDLLKRSVARDGTEIPITHRQFELLEYLLNHAHEVVTREMIANDVWKEPTATWTNVIEVYVNQLRKKIERDGWKPILHTVRGQGYVLGDIPCTD
jgi:DNA-binding response OmpR family regulator